MPQPNLPPFFAMPASDRAETARPSGRFLHGARGFDAARARQTAGLRRRRIPLAPVRAWAGGAPGCAPGGAPGGAPAGAPVGAAAGWAAVCEVALDDDLFGRREIDGGEGRRGALGMQRNNAERSRTRTRYLHDASRRVIARNELPELPFGHGAMPYRDGQRSCMCCAPRAGCAPRVPPAFLHRSGGQRPVAHVLVKSEAPDLLRAELSQAGWRPAPIGVGGLTDPYPPIERRLRITRGCLEVLATLGHPMCLVTRSQDVVFDLDLLAGLAARKLATLLIPIPTLDGRLCEALDPGAPSPLHRLHTVHRLAEAGVPVGVLVAPALPGLTDHELPALLAAAAGAGACHAGHGLLRLTPPDVDAFSDWLAQHAPGRREVVLSRLRSLHDEAPGAGCSARGGGSLGPHAQHVEDLFQQAARRAGLALRGPTLRTDLFRPASVGQLQLFAGG